MSDSLESQPLLSSQSYHSLPDDDDDDHGDDHINHTSNMNALNTVPSYNQPSASPYYNTTVSLDSNTNVPDDPMMAETAVAPANPVDAARETVAEQLSTTNGCPKWFRIIFNTIELTVLIALLIVTRHSPCGSPTDKWNETKLKVLLGFYIFTTAGVTVTLALNLASTSIYRLFSQTSSALGAVSLFALMDGTCNETNHPLYVTILVIASINFLTFALPFLLLLLIICCFPCLLVCLSFFPFLGSQEAGPASDEELELLPAFDYDESTYDLSGEGYPDSTAAHTAELERLRRAAANSAPVPGQDAPIERSTTETPQCAICLCEYEHGDSLRRFHCRHDFHQDCIYGWLKTKAICPVCRIHIFERDQDGNITAINGRRLDGTVLGTYQSPDITPATLNSTSSDLTTPSPTSHNDGQNSDDFVAVKVQDAVHYD